MDSDGWRTKKRQNRKKHRDDIESVCQLTRVDTGVRALPPGVSHIKLISPIRLLMNYSSIQPVKCMTKAAAYF